MPIDLTNDLQVLAATIDGEAEGEPLVGQQAVAVSILNRAKLAGQHPHFGDGTVKGACLAPSQYDCWMPGPDRDRIMALDFENPSPAFHQCIKVALDAMVENLPSFGDPTYYYAPAACAGPAWLVGAHFCGQYGTQLFWRGVK